MSPIATSNVEIVDIRGTNLQSSLSQDIYHGLQAAEKSLPTLLLYDTKGLRLFEDITYLDEYYLTNAEIKVLEANAAKIAALVPENCQLVELGSGFVFLSPSMPLPSRIPRKYPIPLFTGYSILTASVGIYERSKSC